VPTGLDKFWQADQITPVAVTGWAQIDGSGGVAIAFVPLVCQDSVEM
jgi:hypothetical protein